MQKRYAFVWIIALFALTTNTIEAQDKMTPLSVAKKNILPPSDMVLSYEFTTMEEEDMGDVAPENLGPEMMADQAAEVLLTLHFFSLENLSKIKVNIGTKASTSDFLNHTFHLTDGKKESSPYVLEQEKNRIILHCGSVKGVPLLYADVTLEDDQGNASEIKYFKPE